MQDYYKKILKVDDNSIEAIYNYQKFLTKEHIEQMDLPPELKEKKERITGHKLNLKNTNLAVIDLDLKKDIQFIDLDYDKYELEYFKELKYQIISTYGYYEQFITTNEILIYHAKLFNTLFVKTPNDGYHFYFENDLNPEQIAEIFGHINFRYIKCQTGPIETDVFLSDKTNDNYICLPFSKIITEKKDQNGNNVFGEYSGFCTLSNDKQVNIRKLSEIINILKKFICPKEFSENISYETNPFYKDNGWDKRPIICKDEESKINLIKNWEILYKLVDEKVVEIRSWESKIDSYDLARTIVGNPFNMIFPIADLCLKFFTEKNKISINALKRFPTDLRRAMKSNQIWNPFYFRGVISKKFEISSDQINLNKVYYVYPNEESIKKNFGNNTASIDMPNFDIEDLINYLKDKYKIGN